MIARSIVKLITLAAVVAGTTGECCWAQVTRPEPKYMLFRGRPLPTCKSFFIWESAFILRVNNPGIDRFERRVQPAATLDGGIMWNLSPTQGLGGVIHLSLATESSRIAALVRYRRWLSEMPAGSGNRPLRIDFDAGPVITTIDGNYYGQKALNLSAGIALNFEDFAALMLRFDTYRTNQYDEYDYGNPPRIIRTVQAKTYGTFYAGMKLGSYAGAITSVLAGGGYLALLALFWHSS